MGGGRNPLFASPDVQPSSEPFFDVKPLHFQFRWMPGQVRMNTNGCGAILGATLFHGSRRRRNINPPFIPRWCIKYAWQLQTINRSEEDRRRTDYFMACRRGKRTITGYFQRFLIDLSHQWDSFVCVNLDLLIYHVTF